MVRKHELACRDEWSHDLWQARSDQPGADAAPLTDLFPDRKMPPATESEIAALLHAQRTPNGAGADVSGHNGPDDVLLSELGAPTERPTSTYRQRPDIVPEWATPNRRPAESPPSPAPISELGTRSAIIRARETYRERSRLQAARSSEITRLTAKADLEQPRNDDVEPHPGTVNVDADDELATASGTFEDSAPSSFVSSTEGIPTSRTGEDATNRLASSYQVPGAHRQEPSHESSPTAASIADSSPSVDPPRDAEPTWLTEHPDFVSAPEAAESRPWPAGNEADIGRADAGRFPVYDNVEPEASDRASDERSSAELPNPDEYEAAQVASEQWLDDVVVDDDYEDELAPPGLDLAAHLPRICRTCRDFRPAENGDRGWCANQWAFSHRRVVDADERTPCDGVLGNWWLPVDEVWSEAADVSSHGQPTPLLDAWLPQPQQKEPARRRS